jgi:hypothetical protein
MYGSTLQGKELQVKEDVKSFFPWESYMWPQCVCDMTLL